MSPDTPPPELDGRPLDPAAAGALTGALAYGHFTALRVDGGRARGLRHHLDRLVRDCRRLFGAELDPDRVRAALRRTAERCPEPVMLRATVFDPAFDVTRPASSPVVPGVLVTTRPVRPPRPGGRPDSPGLRLRTCTYVRDLPAVKHVAMVGPLHRRREAQAAGADDALFVTAAGPDGRVAEGPTWNLGLVLDGAVVWPDGDCLPGVTRTLLQEVLDAAGSPWSARPVRRCELAAAEGAFVTSAGIGVVPVASVDDLPLAPDPTLLTALRDAYAALPPDRL